MYIIEKTKIFDEWLASIKSIQYRARIIKRFDMVELGSFGDYKSVGNNLFELRFFFGSGYRVYYTIKDEKVIFLLSGGDKSTQKKDIIKANKIMNNLE